MMVSGEMSKDLMQFRIDSYLTRISGMKFRTAELDEDDYKKWDNTIKLYRAKQNNFLYIATYPRRFTVNNIEQDMTRLQEETGRKGKDLFMPLRTTLTGRHEGPEMKVLLPLIGRERVVARLQGEEA